MILRLPPSAFRLLRFWLPSLVLIAISVAALFTADNRSRSLALNTLKLVAGTLAISLPLGTLLGLLIARTDLPLRRIAAMGIGLLLILPLYLQAGAWQLGFGLYGWFTLAFGGELQEPWLAGWRGAVFVHAAAAVPWVALFAGLASRQVEPQLEEAALLDASPRRVFRHVTLRRISPSIGLAALWVALSVATDMTVTDLFQIRTYAEEVYVDFAAPTDITAAPLGPWSGAAVITALAAIAIALCTGASQYSARLLPGQTHRFSLGSWRWPAATAVGLALVIALGVPLANLIYKAGVVVERTGDGCNTIVVCSEVRAHRFGSPDHYKNEIGMSLLIAVGAATASLLVALPLAWLARRGGMKAIPAVFIGAAALAIPAPLLAIGLIHLLNNPDVTWLGWMYHTVAAPMLGQAIRALPLTLFIAWFSLRTISEEQFEAAALDGAGAWRRFLRIALPQRWATVAGAWAAAFVLALNELPATLLLQPPGPMTLPVAIYQLMHGTGEDRLAGIVLFVMLAYALLGTAIYICGRCLLRRQNA